MVAKHLRSDFSEEEAHFFTRGRVIVGTDNVLTGLFKYVGMFSELQAYNRTAEITSYNPNTDFFFKRENMGYTIMRQEIAKKHTPISRRYIKALSRKWPCSFVRIHFDAVTIISELFAYISARDELKAACDTYLQGYNLKTGWDEIIPIQFDFLGVRIQDHHDNWQIAERIVDELTITASEALYEVS